MKKKKEKYIKICPKCGSTNIGQVKDICHYQAGAILTDYCLDCNYGYPHGAHMPEVEESGIEEFRKKLKGGK